MNLSKGFRFSLFLLGLLFPQGLGTVEFLVTQGSEIRYYVDHPLHDVIGVNQEVMGEFAFDPSQPEDLSGFKDRVIKVRWDRFDSGNRNRDAQVLRAVNAMSYPEVVFRITGLEGFTLGTDSGRAVVSGLLYINGQRRGITVPVEFAGWNPTRVTGEFRVRMSDFQIEPPSLLFIPARDEVRIEFLLYLTPVEKKR